MGAYAGITTSWISQTDSGRIFTSTQRVVQSGLVLNLDAGASTSYPGSGTTWTDLSGSGNNGTLTNGPTFNSANGGSIVFDGTNEYVTSTFSTTSGQAVTYTGWLYSTETTATYKNFVDSVTANPMIWWNTSGQIEFDAALYTTPAVYRNQWVYVALSKPSGSSSASYYVNGVLVGSGSAYTTPALTPTWLNRGGSQTWKGNCSVIQTYNRALTATEILQNYNALKGRFISFTPEYETLTYTASGNLTVTGNGTDTVNIFRTSGVNAWDNQAYSTTPFTAPCTIEFNKQAASGDNGVSYAMIGWNADPLTNASYDTLDYASYPYRTDTYQVYHNGSLVQNGGTWSTANKFYIVYGTDGTIKHYNGSTLLYSVNYGTGNTVYVDSSFYSVDATFGGFSNIKVRRSAWNGTTYVG